MAGGRASFVLAVHLNLESYKLIEIHGYDFIFNLIIYYIWNIACSTLI